MVVVAAASPASEAATGSADTPVAELRSSGEAALGWQFTCGEGAFDLGVFEAPADAEQGDHPSDAALRKVLEKGKHGQPVSGQGWRLLYRDEEVAQYSHGEPRKRLTVIAVSTRYTDDGGWDFLNSGGCRPATFAAGLNGADWQHRGPSPSGSDRTVRAWVTETACASGRSAEGRIVEPKISYGAKRIVIAAFVRPQKGASQTCPSNPPVLHTFQLSEPIGDRVVSDGHEFPFERRTRAGSGTDGPSGEAPPPGVRYFEGSFRGLRKASISFQVADFLPSEILVETRARCRAGRDGQGGGAANTRINTSFNPVDTVGEGGRFKTKDRFRNKRHYLVRKLAGAPRGEDVYMGRFAAKFADDGRRAKSCRTGRLRWKTKEISAERWEQIRGER